MSTYEFKILIDREGVMGEYGSPGFEMKPAGHGDLQLDQLTLETVGLMNRWLSFWDRIEGSEIRRKEALLHPSTLEVLGTHLWRLILANEVGRELKEKIPEEGKPPLRLLIEFDDSADTALKGLPWEFLFEPEKGWFLATKTELLLTRYVTTETGRAKLRQVSDKEELRVLLIAALPGGDEFAPHREALWKLRTALKNVSNLEVSRPIGVWNQGEITKALAAKPHHIIHVVGICRGAPGNPQIYLGGGGDGFHAPAQFVECLTANATRTRLVILQLCDFVDGDATENFERLAPALIKRQVPAVLALQYAARVDQADDVGLGEQFYQSLVDGEPIGAAVQASRRRLQGEHPDRRFGTPVLYLQEDGALRRPLSQSGGITSTAQSGTSEGYTIRRTLIDVVVGAEGLEQKQQEALLEWVAALDPQLDYAAATNVIKDQMLTPLNVSSRRVHLQMLRELGRGRDHAQT